jgi:hypothetical protein
MYGYYFYSSDFQAILSKEGMYSTKLENKSGRISFDFFMLDESGKGGKQPADVLTQCLTLDGCRSTALGQPAQCSVRCSPAAYC